MMDLFDEHAVRDLVLYADNTEALYKARKPFEVNAMRRIVKGTYDAEKAVKLWGYYADRAAHAYTAEFGAADCQIFTKADRMQAAREFSAAFEAMVRGGEVTPTDLGVKGEVPAGF